MENEINNLWQLMLWKTGIFISVLGSISYYFLNKLAVAEKQLATMSKKVDEALAVQKNIVNIQSSIEKIEIAILGSYEKPFEGLVHKHKDLERRVNELESVER